jgi:hypothetical protein
VIGSQLRQSGGRYKSGGLPRRELRPLSAIPVRYSDLATLAARGARWWPCVTVRVVPRKSLDDPRQVLQRGLTVSSANGFTLEEIQAYMRGTSKSAPKEHEHEHE